MMQAARGIECSSKWPLLLSVLWAYLNESASTGAAGYALTGLYSSFCESSVSSSTQVWLTPHRLTVKVVLLLMTFQICIRSLF